MAWQQGASAKLDAAHGQKYTDHLTTLDPDSQFTIEGEEEKGALALRERWKREP